MTNTDQLSVNEHLLNNPMCAENYMDLKFTYNSNRPAVSWNRIYVVVLKEKKNNK